MIGAYMWQEVHRQRERWVLFLPFLTAAGIALYFYLPDEPELIYGLLPMLACYGVSILLKAFEHSQDGGEKLMVALARYALIALGTIALGFSVAKVAQMKSHAPVLGFKLSGVKVEGVVSDIQYLSRRTRVTIDNPVIERLDQHKTPQRLRISLAGSSNRPLSELAAVSKMREASIAETQVYKEVHADLRSAETSEFASAVELRKRSNIQVGDYISVKATVFPPPSPARAGGFDPGRQMYFDSIGASGYGGSASVLDQRQESGFHPRLQRFRKSLSDYIMNSVSFPENTIALALITGEQRLIPDHLNDAYRASGIMHILSISGFHIGLVAAFSFWLARLLMALIPKLALEYPIKKYAAVVSIFATLFYLLISGMQVPAIRSFIMALIMALAVLVDRQAISIRNVCLAALLILIASPVSLLSPSFQLSFAATLALVSFYESLAPKIAVRFHGSGYIKQSIYYFIGIILTSLVAGLATAPLIIFHFNQVNPYGFLGNLAAIPLSSFIVIPAAAAALLLMPLGLDAPFFWILEKSIDIQNDIAVYLSTFPEAEIFVHAPTRAGIWLVISGLFWFCIWRGRVRLLGIIPFVMGMLTALHTSAPDILVDKDNIALHLDDNRVVMLKGSADSYTGERWVHSLAAVAVATDAIGGSFKCMEGLCELTHKGQRMALIMNDNYSLICGEYDISISLVRGVNCQAPVTITYWELLKKGTHEIYLTPFKINTANEMRGNRPWATR